MTSQPQSQPAEPLRIGMLGASRIAELAILEATAHTGDVRAAVAARDPQRATAYAAEHGFAATHDDYAALIADDSLDIVYIGLPNGLHAEWTARALEAGRSVLVEKPFAANLAEFDRVVQRLDASPGWAWEAFHYADHPLIARILELLQAGEIGELREVRVHMRMPDPGAHDPRWSYDLAGGAMMDLGCYALHALLTIGDATGRALTLARAKATPYGPDKRVDAAVDAEFTLGDAQVTMRTNMQHSEFDFALELVGTAGSLLTPNFVKPQEDDRLIVRTGAAGASAEATERTERVGTTSSYVYQLERVRRELRAGVRDSERLARSRNTMALIDEIYTATGLPLRPARLED
ncbi:Gfo/Idh/MocA family protein [Leucobacter sp. HY1908]